MSKNINATSINLYFTYPSRSVFAKPTNTKVFSRFINLISPKRMSVAIEGEYKTANIWKKLSKLLAKPKLETLVLTVSQIKQKITYSGTETIKSSVRNLEIIFNERSGNKIPYLDLPWQMVNFRLKKLVLHLALSDTYFDSGSHLKTLLEIPANETTIYLRAADICKQENLAPFNLKNLEVTNSTSSIESLSQKYTYSEFLTDAPEGEIKP